MRKMIKYPGPQNTSPSLIQEKNLFLIKISTGLPQTCKLVLGPNTGLGALGNLYVLLLGCLGKVSQVISQG